jgi:hypothetical protein
VLYRQDAADGSKNNLVINNTIAMAGDARWALYIQDGSTGNTVSNNVFWNDNLSTGSLDVSADSLPGFTSDYNVVADRFTTDDGGSIVSLAQWQAATGKDQHSLVSTPDQVFVDAANNDFRLAANSPAIGAGTAQNAPSTDIAGNLRTGSAIDIGAYSASA